MPPSIEEAVASAACRGVIAQPPSPDRAMQLLPGDAAILSIEAGGRLAIAAAGERVEVVATTGLWVKVQVPLEAATRAAEAGSAEL
eukprot:1878941-Lingulodinium_polyedra.AAC.1